MPSLEAEAGLRRANARLIHGAVFFCFFISGFCSLLYQVLWTRLAYGHFGIITPVLSLTISTFMLGLGIGSIAGGRWLRLLSQRLRVSPLHLYAAAEITVAIGAFAVPAIFGWGGSVLLRAGVASSAGFLMLSGAFIVLALLPWCVAMGATVPLMMGFVRQIEGPDSESFGFLYIANVLGAASGAAITALALVELFGIRGTTIVGALGNILIALLAVGLARGTASPALSAEEPGADAALPAGTDRDPGWLVPVLFITGFSCVGMEVCWARDFTLVLLTSIYAFASILAVYLLATFAGSALYSQMKKAGSVVRFEDAAGWLFPLSLVPVALTDPRFHHTIFTTLFSIVPLCGLLGYTTPALIDRFGGGDPKRTGHLYAINIAGGILGPLVAGYLLLPLAGIRWSIIILALPFVAAFLFTNGRAAWTRTPILIAMGLMILVSVFFRRSYDEGSVYHGPHQVHRDYAASVVAYGSGMDKRLVVNGVQITVLTTITKVMAHLPMALRGNAHTVLDICFGMGTTFRSLSTWDVDTTAVDLSPSVISSFGFFHDDAAAVLANPNDHTVADDGRRFLIRTTKHFDVITIDPPPPVEASGSSLLYSVQFYDVLKRRLAPGGILAQWVPAAKPATLQSIALALKLSFPYIRVLRSQGYFGTHFIASMTPVPAIGTDEFIRRMPPAARQDLLEWEPGVSLHDYVQATLAREVPLSSVLPPPGSNIPALSDDRPFNEYFFLRRVGLLH